MIQGQEDVLGVRRAEAGWLGTPAWLVAGAGVVFAGSSAGEWRLRTGPAEPTPAAVSGPVSAVLIDGDGDGPRLLVAAYRGAVWALGASGRWRHLHGEPAAAAVLCLTRTNRGVVAGDAAGRVRALVAEGVPAWQLGAPVLALAAQGDQLLALLRGGELWLGGAAPRRVARELGRVHGIVALAEGFVAWSDDGLALLDGGDGQIRARHALDCAVRRVLVVPGGLVIVGERGELFSIDDGLEGALAVALPGGGEVAGGCAASGGFVAWTRAGALFAFAGLGHDVRDLGGAEVTLAAVDGRTLWCWAAGGQLTEALLP
jgi:hypothetical protein